MDKILIVEDEKLIGELLADNLDFEGYETYNASTLDDATKQLNKSTYSLVILDVNLPDGNGIEWLSNLREKQNSIPVIICTIRDREIDVVKALDVGADDYITKPFRIRELLSRVKALLRRVLKEEQTSKVKIGELEIDFSSKEVWLNQKSASLTVTEWQILEYMFANKGLVLSRDQIINKIWGIDDLEDTRAVDVHIGRLRKKIETTNKPEILVTIRGFGYTLKI